MSQCRWAGCQRDATVSFVFALRKLGREGRQAGGFVEGSSAVLCEEHGETAMTWVREGQDTWLSK